jgi:hypothetical protein
MIRLRHLQQREVKLQTRNLTKTASPMISPIPTPQLKQKRRKIYRPRLLPMLKQKKMLKHTLLLKPKPRKLKQKKMLKHTLLLKPKPRKHLKRKPDRKKKLPLPAPNICVLELLRLLLLSLRSEMLHRITRLKQQPPPLLPPLNLPVLLWLTRPACEYCCYSSFRIQYKH